MSWSILGSVKKKDAGTAASQKNTASVQETPKKQPPKVMARLIMFDKRGSQTKKHSECYVWSRMAKGFGWYYASETPPPQV